MAKYVELQVGEDKHPVSFGMLALSNFCEKQNLTLAEMNASLGQKLSIQALLDLIHCGLQDGYRKAGKDFQMDIADVADMIDDHPEALAAFMDEIAGNLPQSDTEKKHKPGTRAKTKPAAKRKV